MSSATNKMWIILEQSAINGAIKHTVIAGTEDEKAINKALTALMEYKDYCIKTNKLDLTEIRSNKVEQINPVNQVLEQDDSDSIDRVMSMVNM